MVMFPCPIWRLAEHALFGQNCTDACIGSMSSCCMDTGCGSTRVFSNAPGGIRSWSRLPSCFFAGGGLANGTQPGQADERDAETKADGNEPKFGTGAADDQQRASQPRTECEPNLGHQAIDAVDAPLQGIVYERDAISIGCSEVDGIHHGEDGPAGDEQQRRLRQREQAGAGCPEQRASHQAPAYRAAGAEPGTES